MSANMCVVSQLAIYKIYQLEDCAQRAYKRDIEDGRSQIAENAPAQCIYRNVLHK